MYLLELIDHYNYLITTINSNKYILKLIIVIK